MQILILLVSYSSLHTQYYHIYIALLQLCQLHNANQLSGWCLHFISSNYLVFEQKEEFPQLGQQNLEYIEQHRYILLLCVSMHCFILIDGLLCHILKQWKSTRGNTVAMKKLPKELEEDDNGRNVLLCDVCEHVL